MIEYAVIQLLMMNGPNEMQRFKHKTQMERLFSRQQPLMYPIMTTFPPEKGKPQKKGSLSLSGEVMKG